MQFKVSFDPEFDDVMYHLWSKYGRDLFTLDGIGDQMDLDKFAKQFFSKKTVNMADMSVDANANVASKSVIDWQFEFAKPLQRYNSYYLMWKKMKELYGLEKANAAVEMQLLGTLYINDFSDVGRPYCYNFSTYDIALSGLEMSNRMRVKAPKSMATFIRQVEQFTVYAANSTLGATGLADFLLVLSMFYEKALQLGRDGHVNVKDLDKYTYELIASFIYTVNWEFRGNQSPFTNISLYDIYFLRKLCPDYILDGVHADERHVQKLQRMFCKAMNAELERSPLTFPVTTACFSTDADNKIKDKGFAREIAEANLQWGFINIYYGKTSTLSSCCRLRSEADNPYFNSFGSGSTKIGSLGVVTVNLPRLAKGASQIGSQAKEMLLYHVAEVSAFCALINNAKREILKERIEAGAMPLYTLGHMDLKTQYSTTGFTGLNECVEIMGYSILDGEGKELAKSILNTINDVQEKFAEVYQAPHNLEQVPAESSAVKLAAKDKFLGIDTGYDIYSNQFIPLSTQVDPFTRLNLQGEFDKYCTGGSICHINLNEPVKSVDAMLHLMEAASESGTVYWAANYALQQCDNGHMWVGSGVCPQCGEPTSSIWTRVVGFLTKVDNWNKVRREQDFPSRVWN